MEVSFDTEKRGNHAPSTRIYAPTHKSEVELKVLSEEGTAVRPQPKAEAAEKARAQAAAPRVDKADLLSRLLLLLTVFMIAATAILAIDGNARVAKIYTEIYELQDEITSYENQISLLEKEQSALNDYTTINQANQDAGRTMNWELGD